MNLKQKFFLCLEIESIFDSWLSAYSKTLANRSCEGRLNHNRNYHYSEEINTLCKMGAMVGGLVYASIEHKMIRVFDKNGKLIIEKTTKSCNYNLKEMALKIAKNNGFDSYADARLAHILCVVDRGICPIKDTFKPCGKCPIMKLMDKYQLCTLGFIDILHSVDKIYQTSHYKKLIKEKQLEMDLRLNDYLAKRKLNK
jgi:hypothetical protein